MILVIGGTHDAYEIACHINEDMDNVILSLATEYGYETYSQRFKGPIAYGRKNKEEFKTFILEKDISAVVDATHPYALEVSRNAEKACRELSIPYIRYERPACDIDYSNMILCDSFKEAGIKAEELKGNILLTTGSKNIKEIISNIKDKKRIKVRVLPMSESILKLESLGLNADNIIAMKGPFSEEMNYLIMKEFEISIMICKDSGAAGGLYEKLKAAYNAGVKVIMVNRPKSNGEETIYTMGDVLNFLQKNKYVREDLK